MLDMDIACELLLKILYCEHCSINDWRRKLR
jgi:hypothetical protein